MKHPDGVDEKGNVVSFQPLKSDTDIAHELREAARPHLEAITELMNSAQSQGMALNFAIQPNSFGKSRVIDISVVKLL